MHAFAHLIAVDDQPAERRHHEHDQESVQQRGARRDEADAVGDEQQPGDAADEGGAADPAHDPHHQQHHDDAADGAGEAPAQAVVAEDRLTDRDQLLADGWVHDQPVAGVVLDAVVVQHLPGLRHVVLLVEDRRARVGGDPRFRNRVTAASAVTTAVIAQPCSRSTGPKSATGTSGAG